jgi:hypothetical protein
VALADYLQLLKKLLRWGIVVTASKASSIVVKSSNTLMKVASLSANVFKVTNIINGAVSTFPVGKGPDNLKDIIVTNKSGKELLD